jgi:hypothetical protein
LITTLKTKVYTKVNTAKSLFSKDNGIGTAET